MDGPKPTSDQSQPFLSAGRPSEDENDIELAQYAGNHLSREEDETPLAHYEPHAPPAQGATSPLLVTGALIIAVLGFVVNTEATAYFEDVLGWKKPFATLYITHSSLAVPWAIHVAWLRYRNRHVDYRVWVRDYNNRLRDSVSSIDAYATDMPKLVLKGPGRVGGPMDFLATAMAIVTVVLTVSGVSWFLSLVLTTPGDLTAIYNCSTFFAAVFSVPLLKERLGKATIAAVALSIAGTFIIAYGDTTAEHPVKDDDDAASKVGTSRLLGNIVACVGALAFGLYEVLFKKWACSSQPTRPQDTIPLTLAANALTGIYTFATLWVGLLLLHLFDLEPFVLPSPKVALWIAIAVLAGMSKSIHFISPSLRTLEMRNSIDSLHTTCFVDPSPASITTLVVLVIWTGPIFGSFANVLSVFFVALADWVVFGLSPTLATYAGGVLIVVGFGMLAWDTFKGGGKH